MSVQSAYDEWSHTYDDDPNVTKELDQRVTAEVLGTMRGKLALELGCGTGKNTASLADRFESVVAVDFSAGMLRRARENVSAANVTFLEADLLKRWPCADRCVDLATINLVLEHVADLTPVYAEAARVLRPGAQLFVCELHPFRQYKGTQARFEKQGQTVRIPAHRHDVSDFLSAASASGLALSQLREWWTDDDRQGAPRLISFLFQQSA